MEPKNELIEYFLDKVVPQVVAQLEDDQKRWGDEWKNRPRHGQEQRIFDRFWAYFDEFKYENKPVPWQKVIGNAIIAQLREDRDLE